MGIYTARRTRRWFCAAWPRVPVYDRIRIREFNIMIVFVFIFIVTMKNAKYATGLEYRVSFPKRDDRRLQARPQARI